MATQDPRDGQGRTPSGLDPNERLPTGDLKREARSHPEEFTRNTGAGGALTDDRAASARQFGAPEKEVIPSDAPGG